MLGSAFQVVTNASFPLRTLIVFGPWDIFVILGMNQVDPESCFGMSYDIGQSHIRVPPVDDEADGDDASNTIAQQEVSQVTESRNYGDTSKFNTLKRILLCNSTDYGRT
ncbi:hypothetical protein HG530_009689 [Fusarium avenaceum]|nr:hypothetical protein HG530_009689 [Fusarium avenaceum]